MTHASKSCGSHKLKEGRGVGKPGAKEVFPQARPISAHCGKDWCRTYKVEEGDINYMPSEDDQPRRQADDGGAMHRAGRTCSRKTFSNDKAPPVLPDVERVVLACRRMPDSAIASYQRQYPWHLVGCQCELCLSDELAQFLSQ